MKSGEQNEATHSVNAIIYVPSSPEDNCHRDVTRCLFCCI
jgi:hypothetical protein